MAPRLIDRDLVALFRPADRSPGHHVSTAIHNIMEYLYPDRFGRGETYKPNQDRLDLGTAVEHALATGLAEAYPDRFMQPGELTLEGVTGTPDLWDINLWATIEIKLTWASSRRAEDIEDPWFIRYWWQLKSYAHMAGMTKGFLIIYFINGNYTYDTPEGGPQGMMWEDDWDAEELNETWQMIKANLG